MRQVCSKSQTIWCQTTYIYVGSGSDPDATPIKTTTPFMHLCSEEVWLLAVSYTTAHHTFKGNCKHANNQINKETGTQALLHRHQASTAHARSIVMARPAMANAINNAVKCLGQRVGQREEHSGNDPNSPSQTRATVSEAPTARQSFTRSRCTTDTQNSLEHRRLLHDGTAGGDHTRRVCTGSPLPCVCVPLPSLFLVQPRSLALLWRPRTRPAALPEAPRLVLACGGAARAVRCSLCKKKGGAATSRLTAAGTDAAVGPDAEPYG